MPAYRFPASIRGVATVAAAALLLGGCGGDSGAGDSSEEEGESPEPPPGSGEPVLEKVGTFEEPIHLAVPPDGDGTLYVAERAGVIRAVAPGGEAEADAFLDISKDVLTEGEGGLFSLAFAPDHAESGLVYFAYSSKDHKLVIEEAKSNPERGTVDPGSRRVIFEADHPNAVHWGGMLAFGPDEELYVGTGDGGPPYPIPDTAQDPDSPLGKLLRLDRKGGRPEVAALGLRNPWRYSFDSRTGEAWIGDVGDFTQEEVNRVNAEQLDGINFGWPDLEGTAQTTSDAKAPGATDPYLTYARSGKPDDPVCAITGGHVVRDPELPSLEGRYVYADFCEGTILSVDPNAKGKPKPRETGLEASRIASFAEGPGGETYVVSLEGGVQRIAPG